MEFENLNFLRAYVELHKNTEVPEDFAFWSGVASVSSVLGRNVWFDMGTFTIYPNFYIVLVAGSGRFRKSTSIGVMERLVRQTVSPPNLIAQKITPEALIEALKVRKDSKSLLPRCEGFVIADEFSTFLNKKSYEAGLGSLLTSLFDCKDNFEYRTKGRGAEKLSNSCLGILGATTVDWLKNAIPEDAIGGGLTSRILFVFVDELPEPVPLPTFSESQKLILGWLIKRLNEIARVSGELKMSPEAEEAFRKEYIRFYRNSPLYDDPLLAGYASRRSVHLIKLAMILNITEEQSKRSELIEPRHIEAAKMLLDKLEKSLKTVMRLISTSETGELLSRVEKTIFTKGLISRTDLMRLYSHKLDARGLEELIQTLIASGKVQTVVDGKRVLYRRT